MTDVQNVVLVHGGFVDGSGWQGVYDLLKADGFNVSVVQNQTLSLESDVQTTRNVLDLQDGPAILVGHSYGGAVITEAGRHENVAGLVYIAAFAPDAGESVSTLIADPPAGAPVPPILSPIDGFLFLDREKFADSFAADVPAALAAFMADSQVPWGVEALNGAISEPAWRTKPSWYLVATDDRMIPPPAQRAMSERAGSTVVEEAGSHSIYVSQPHATADLIKHAAQRAFAAEAVAGSPRWPAGRSKSCRPHPAPERGAPNRLGGKRCQPHPMGSMHRCPTTSRRRPASSYSSRSSS
jgi:pimeloyl-ACP methyl ester carboxylesterase